MPDTPPEEGGKPDLWKFDLSTQEWSFVAGSLDYITDIITADDPLDVTPSQRWGAQTAVDSSYNLW